jgi:hypothetical protein
MNYREKINIDQLLSAYNSSDLIKFDFDPFNLTLTILIFDVWDKKNVEIVFEDVIGFSFESRDGLKSALDNLKDIWEFGLQLEENAIVSRNIPNQTSYEANFFLTTTFHAFYWQAKGFHLEGKFYAV